MAKKILVTGAAGFIGSHLSIRLLERGDTVVGIDNLNDYYEVSLKENRTMFLNQVSSIESSEQGNQFVKKSLKELLE